MKLVLMAAAVAFAAPAIAQTTPTDGSMGTDTTMSPQDQTTAPDMGMQDQGTMSDGTMATGTTGTMSTTSTPGAMSGGTMTSGGYAPSGSPMSGQLAPGQQAQFQPSQSPSQAFPPPAAIDNYPVCKAGQTDHCRERENARGQGVRGR